MYMITTHKLFTMDNIYAIFKKNHGDTYDYSKFIYVNAHSKGEIICPIHGSFFQSYNNHKKGVGCPKCSGKGKSSDEIIIDFRSIHGNKYDYSKCSQHQPRNLSIRFY